MPLLSRGGAILCALPFCASADVVFREDGFGTQAADQSWEFVYQGESGGWHHESDAALLTGSARGRWSASAQTEVEGQPGEPVWLGMRSGGGCSRGDIEAGLSASRDGGVTWERIAEATNFDPATGALGVLARISDAGAGTIRIRLEFSSDNGAGCQLALHSATFINGHAPVAHVWGPFDVDGPDQQWLVTLLDADGDAVTLTPVGSSALAILGTTAGAIPGATDLVLQLRGDPPAGCTEFSVLASSGMLSTMLSGILDPPGVSCVEGHREALLVSTGEVVALTPGDPGAMARIPAFRPAGMSRRWPTLRGSRTTVRLLDPLDTDVCPGPVPVSGQIWPINGLSEVVVNGAPVPVAADGTFASWTNVQGMGQQTIVVAGIDAASVVTSASRVITVNPCPSKPEIEPCIAELAGGSTAALTHCSGVSWSFEAPMLGRIAGSTTLALASLTRADGIDGITGVVVEGLLPQTTYRILKGGFFNSTDMVSDDFGKLQFSAALGALPRALWLQVVPATIQIDGTPASCFAAGGLPNAGTCHMNGKHLTDAVQITSGTLDCGGGNIQGQGFGVGVEVQHTNGAIIRNCQITNWELGAWVHGSANVRFEMSEITNVVAGLFVDDTTDFRLTDSTVLSGTDASLFSIGISIANTDLVDVTSVEVSGFTFGITARLSPGLVVSTTTVDSAAVGVVLAKTPGARLEEVDVKATAFGVRLSGEDDPACAVELAGVTLEAWPPDGNHSFIAADIVGCPDFHLGELGSGIFSRVFDGLVVVGSSPNARIDRTRFEGDGHPSVVEMLRIGIGSDGATVGPFVSVDGAFAAGVVSQASDVSIDDVTVTGPWQAKPGESTGAAPFSVGILVNGYPTSTPGSQSGESGPPAAQQANRLTDIDVSGVGTGVYIVGASGTEITDASIHDNAVVGVRLGGVLVEMPPWTLGYGANDTRITGTTSIRRNGSGVVSDVWSRSTLIEGVTIADNRHANVRLGGVDEVITESVIRGVPQPITFEDANKPDVTPTPTTDCVLLAPVGIGGVRPTVDWVPTRCEVSHNQIVGCGRAVGLVGAQGCQIRDNQIANNVHAVHFQAALAEISRSAHPVGYKDPTGKRNIIARSVAPCDNVVRDNDVATDYGDKIVDHGMGITVVGQAQARWNPETQSFIQLPPSLASNPVLHNNFVNCCNSDAGGCLCQPVPMSDPPNDLPDEIKGPLAVCSLPSSEPGIIAGVLSDPVELRDTCHFARFSFEARAPQLHLFDIRRHLADATGESVLNPTFRHGNYWGHSGCGTPPGRTWFGAHPGRRDTFQSVWHLAPLPDSNANRAADCHPYQQADGWTGGQAPPDLTATQYACQEIYTPVPLPPNPAQFKLGELACRGEGPTETPWSLGNVYPRSGDVLVTYGGGDTDVVVWNSPSKQGVYALGREIEDFYSLLQYFGGTDTYFRVHDGAVLNTPTGDLKFAPDRVLTADPIEERRRLMGVGFDLSVTGQTRLMLNAVGPWSHNGVPAGFETIAMTQDGAGNPVHIELAWSQERHTLFVYDSGTHRIVRYGGACLQPIDGLSSDTIVEVPLDPGETRVADIAWDPTRDILLAVVEGAHDYGLVRIDPDTGAAMKVFAAGGPGVSALGIDPQVEDVRAMLLHSSGALFVVTAGVLPDSFGRAWRFDLNAAGTVVLKKTAYVTNLAGPTGGLAEQLVDRGPQLKAGMVLVVDGSATGQTLLALDSDQAYPEPNPADLHVSNGILTTQEPIAKIYAVP